MPDVNEAPAGKRAASRETKANGSPSKADLDQISLEQALLDFEVANARVVDLTRRLTLLNRQLLDQTTKLEKLRLRNKSAEAELKAIKESTAFRSVSAAGRVARRAKARIGK